MKTVWFSRPAELGPESVRMGNLVRPVMVERVKQVWRDHEIVEEVEKLEWTGKYALCFGPPVASWTGDEH